MAKQSWLKRLLFEQNGKIRGRSILAALVISGLLWLQPIFILSMMMSVFSGVITVGWVVGRWIKT